MENKISIVVPVYNVERYLGECLDCILSQSFKDFEVILVNDGSKDSSGAICDEYASRDSRIHVIHKSNAGVSDTRNTGLKVATGQYVVFIDSDDTIHPDYLKILYTEAIKEDLDCVICGYKIVGSKNTRDICVSQPILVDHHTGRAKVAEVYKQKLLNAPWNKIYKREKIISYFDPSIAMGEDLVFNLRFIASSDRLKIIPDVLYNYMIRANSAVTTYKSGRMKDIIKVNNILIDYFSSSDAKDEIVAKCVAEVDGLFRHLFRGHNSKGERKQIIEAWCTCPEYLEFCQEYAADCRVFLAKPGKIYQYYNKKTWLERKIVKLLR